MPGTGAGAAWGVAFGVGSALALVIVALGAARLGALREQARQRQALQDAKRDAAAYRQLARGRSGFGWRTDARGIVVQLDGQPPPGSPAWRGTALAALVDDAEAGDGATLAAVLEARGQVGARGVRLAGENDAAPRRELSAMPLVGADGRFDGYVGVVREASRSADDAAASDEALSLGYTLSHDLRAPVRVVEGFARILKEDYAGQLDRVGNDHLDRVLAAAARMNQMIDALLAMARLATQPLQRQNVDLSQLAGFIVDELRRGAPERRIQFEIEPGMRVQGDPTLLRQLLENLLGNAWKYTQRQPDPQVRFVREVHDGRSGFVVQDNGAGFDMRSVERLFGLFQRLHSASDFPGTGVGLASVKRIVARHGGRIWAEAEPGRGATFHFTLERG